MFNFYSTNRRSFPSAKTLLRTGSHPSSSFILYAGMHAILTPGPDPADPQRIYVKRLVEVKDNVWGIEETRLNLEKQTAHQRLFNLYMDPLFFYSNKEKSIRSGFEKPDILNGASMYVAPQEKGFSATVASFAY